MKHDNTETEIWKDVVGYESKYQVSNLGRVKSLDRPVKYSDGVIRRHKGRILKGDISARGYIRVLLCSDDTSERFLVHRLILSTFTGIYPEDKQVNHIDGNPRNNHLDNLEWCTPSENTIHALENNLRVVGDRHHYSKLTEKDVRDIRNIYAKGGTTHRNLAKEYNVHRRTIERVINKRFWKHIN